MNGFSWSRPLRAGRRGMLAIVAAGAAIGCSKKDPPPAPSPRPTASSSAVDRLLPGELAEGSQRALGLALPRDMQVERAFDDSVVARGRVGPEALANYVRQRVDAKGVEIGAARTLFPRAHVKGQPDEKTVRIEVARDHDSTVLMLFDTTPPPVPPGLSEEERWRKAGVVRGKPFDPTSL